MSALAIYIIGLLISVVFSIAILSTADFTKRMSLGMIIVITLIGFSFWYGIIYLLIMVLK